MAAGGLPPPKGVYATGPLSVLPHYSPLVLVLLTHVARQKSTPGRHREQSGA